MFKSKILLIAALLLAGVTAFAQQITVTGVVTSSADGYGVIGAAIVEKGTTNGTTTDVDGNFTISVQEGAVLEISSIGYVTVEVPATPQMAVVLDEDAQLLEEVVVTGYTVEKKSDLTGSVSVIKMKDIADVPTGNVLSSLNGRVAGVAITTDGAPGGGNTSTQVRGTTTINNSSPLYVIDGVMTRDNVGSILASGDVESIQVLKDAASASIYGAQAANGVIIITTKRAKSGEVKVDFGASLSAQTFTTGYKLLNAQQWGDVYWQAYKYSNGGATPASLIYGNGANAVLNTTSPYYTAPDGETWTATDTDWLKTMYKTALMQNYSLTMSKGDKYGNTSLSVNWIDQDGMLRNTDYKRFNTRLTSDYKFFDGKLQIGESVAINRWTQHFNQGGIEEQLVKLHPAQPVYSDQGGWGGGYMDVLNDTPNPMRLQENQANNRHAYWRIFGNLYAQIEPVKNLFIKTNFGVNYYNDFNSEFVPAWRETSRTVDTNELRVRNNQSLQWVWSNTANYLLDLGKHSLNFLAGLEFKKNYGEHVEGYGTGLIIEDMNYRYLDQVTAGKNVSNMASYYSMISLFGRINYSYDGKYLASVTVRRDASSRFGANNNAGIFPSVSAGWRISREPFMEGTRSWLSDLKLRASWGINGNDEIDNEATYTKYLASLDAASYNISGDNTTLATGAFKSYLGNPYLRWEQTQQLNFGVDASFLNDRLTLGIDWYNKNTSDMLYQPPYAGVIGEGGYTFENCISMNNRGFEFLIGWRNSLDSGFSYDIAFNGSTYTNKITDLPEAIWYTFGGGMPGNSIVGQPFGSWMGYKTEGVFRTQAEVDEYMNKYQVELGAPGVGRIRYADVNGDGKINSSDQTWLGCDRPQFTGGLNLSASWKGFDAAVFFSGMVRQAWNNSKYYTDLFQLWQGNHSTRLLEALDAWKTYESTGTYNSSVPALTAVDNNSEGRSSQFFIENGSFIKLKTLTLGYSLPAGVAEKLHISRARVYVQGENLFTITGYTGADPEGLGYTYPLPRTFTVGLNIGF